MGGPELDLSGSG